MGTLARDRLDAAYQQRHLCGLAGRSCSRCYRADGLEYDGIEGEGVAVQGGILLPRLQESSRTRGRDCDHNTGRRYIRRKVRSGTIGSNKRGDRVAESKERVRLARQ